MPRAAEIERRAGDLRQELDPAHAAQAAKEAAGKTELAAVRAEMRHLMQMVAGAIGAGTMPDKNYSEQKRQ